MSFNSLSFLIFVCIVFFLYWFLPARWQNYILLPASYYFYYRVSGAGTAVLLGLTLFTYGWGRLLSKHPGRTGKRKGLLWTGLVISLVPLAVLKYTPAAGLLAVLGLAYYSLVAAAYLIDVYRGDCEAERNIVTYALFLSFFPPVVSGPIERTRNLLKQLRTERTFLYEDMVSALRLILTGFFKKFVAADTLAGYVNTVYGDVHGYSGLTLVMIVFFYSIQIYGDFAGYSDIVIGLGRLFGIRLLENFRRPYFSHSMAEFWSRWHISLSDWLREYIYFPLGGSRCTRLRTIFNLLITFLVSGIWHEMKLTYLLWGLFHGLFRVLEYLYVKCAGKKISKRWYNRLITYVLAALAWIFFRADSAGDAWYVLTHMTAGLLQPGAYIASLRSGLGVLDNIIKIMLPLCMLGVYDRCCEKAGGDDFWDRMPRFCRWSLYVLIGFMILGYMPAGGQSRFIYFGY